MHTLRKLAAEFFGTFLLIFIGGGAICADQFLGDTGGGIVAIALAHGLAIACGVAAVGHISGAHFNPAVTLGFWVTRKMGTFPALLYWLAQLAGAIAAAHLLKVLLPAEIWGPVLLGTPALAADFTRLQGMVLESVLTFFLVFVIFATALDSRNACRSLAPLAIGSAVAIGVFCGAPFTGAALNPARAFGPAVAANFWANHGVYWVGPLAGGVLAAWLYDFLCLRHSPAPPAA